MRVGVRGAACLDLTDADDRDLEHAQPDGSTDTIAHPDPDRDPDTIAEPDGITDTDTDTDTIAIAAADRDDRRPRSVLRR